MKRWLLALLKIDLEPLGTTDPSCRSFRASRRHLYYLGVQWLGKQATALVGVLFSLAAAGLIQLPYLDIDWLGWAFEQMRLQLGPLSLYPARLFGVFEVLAIGVFTVQLPVTAYLVVLGWEVRRYEVGDDVVRIREGLWRVREQTLSLSRVQNLVLHQGPLQKLFGTADLEIHTAGGGAKTSSDGDEDKARSRDLHVGRLRGLDDASQLRDRLLAHLARLHRGEPEPGTDETPDWAAACRRLLDEARSLRRVATAGVDPGSQLS